MGEFVLTRVLDSDAEKCKTFLLGRFRRDPTDNQVIIKFVKTEFPDEKMQELFPVMQGGGRRQTISSEQYFHNNEWRKFWFDLPKELSRVQTDVIYPATDVLIAKYTRQKYQVVRETHEIYQSIVKPHYIEPMDMKHCNWVYAILNKEKELDLRVHESEKFFLQKDYKFNEGDISTLYCLAIPVQRDLFTIRDLTAEHLPLLKAMRDESLDAIETKFKVDRTKIMCYFHYPPTFYHLHVHFVHIDRCQNETRDCVRLDDCIANIEMIPDYYQRATLTYKIGSKMHLGQLFIEKGVLQPETEEEESKEN